MRYREFKSVLLEFAPPTGQGANDLQLLSNIIELVEPTDPLYHVAMGVIKDLVSTVIDAEPAQEPQAEQPPTQTATAPATQPAPTAATNAPNTTAEPTEEPISEAVATTDEAWYQKFLDGISDPKMADRILKKLRTNKDYREEMRYIHANAEKKIKSAFTKGGTEALVTVDQFFKDVKISADLLAGKAVGVLSELRQWYANEAKRTGERDEDNTRPRPTQNALYQKLLYPLENIFQDLGFKDSPPNLRAFKQESPKILKFMKLCEEGIIEFEELINSENGNIGNLLDSNEDKDLKYIYDKIFDKLLALDAGQGGGAWGPGELGLSILCKPVSKSKGKGDLTSVYQGEEVGVEVKASRNAQSGGRLGGKGVLAGSAGKTNFTKALKELCNLAGVPANDIGKNFTEITKVKTVKGVKTRIATGERKEANSVKATNMASPRWFESFNRQIPPALGKKRSINPSGAVGDFLVGAISAVVSEFGKPFIDEELIRSIPAEDGSIDYEVFKSVLTRQWYEIYKNTDDVGLILVINPTNGNYTLVSSGEMLTNGSSPVVISGGIDFNDSQGKAGPQIGIA